MPSLISLRLRLTRAVCLCALALTALTSSSASAAGKFDVLELTIEDAHAAFKARKLTARQLTQLYLDRIAAYDQQGPAIKCIVTINPAAVADADALDATFAKTGQFAGPLHGIPILVKDEVDTAGMATTQGTVVFKDYLPTRDAFAIAKLKAAGAIILAKTTLSEFAGGDT